MWRDLFLILRDGQCRSLLQIMCMFLNDNSILNCGICSGQPSLGNSIQSLLCSSLNFQTFISGTLLKFLRYQDFSRCCLGTKLGINKTKEDCECISKKSQRQRTGTHTRRWENQARKQWKEFCILHVLEQKCAPLNQNSLYIVGSHFIRDFLYIHAYPHIIKLIYIYPNLRGLLICREPSLSREAECGFSFKPTSKLADIKGRSWPKQRYKGY